MIEWFRHDTDARNDIKIRKLLRDNDRASLGAYWMCVEIIYQNEGYADEEAVLEELSFYNLDEFVPALIALDLVERTGDGKLTSKRVLSEIENNRRMAEVRSEKARKAINTRWHKNSVENNAIRSNTDEYGCIRTDTKHTTQHNTTQQDNITSLSKDSLVGGQQADTPAKNKEETDLFGDKVEGKRDSVPVQKIVEYWNEKVKSTALPQVTKLTNERRAAIKQRWKEYADDIYKVIDKTVASDFLTGRDGKWQMCDFDWVFQRKNTLKIIEGKYDEKDIKVSSKHTGNNRSFRPTDLNGQYDDLPPAEVIEV